MYPFALGLWYYGTNVLYNKNSVTINETVTVYFDYSASNTNSSVTTTTAGLNLTTTAAGLNLTTTVAGLNLTTAKSNSKIAQNYHSISLLLFSLLILFLNLQI